MSNKHKKILLNLEDWSKDPDPAKAKKLIADLKYLLNMSDSAGELKISTENKDIEEYFRQLILGAENYMENKLGFAL